MAYDEKCRELAEYFMDDSESLRRISELAQHIQDAIEDFLATGKPDVG